MNDACIPAVADVYPVESLPKGWITAQVTFQRRDGGQKVRTEIIHLKTKKRYLHEPLRMIAFKCSLLTLWIPFYMAMYIGWNLIRIPTTTCCAMKEQSGKIFQSQTVCEVVQKLIDTAWTGINTALSGIWTIVRTPFYAIQMFFGALIGIFFPLQGRQILEAETFLHQKSIRADFLRHPKENEGDLEPICKSLKEKESSSTFFAAHCMQPLGKTSDQHIIAVQPMAVQ